MNSYEQDIEQWIAEKYPDAARVKRILEPLNSIDFSVATARIVRCVLFLSESDCDSLSVYVKNAVQDVRDVIWWAEYDNRNIRIYDFSNSLYSQKPYSFAN